MNEPAQVTKKCSDCKKHLTIDNFTRCKTTIDGFDYQCINCKKNRNQVQNKKNPHRMIERYKKNPEIIKKATKKWRSSNIERVKEKQKEYLSRCKSNPIFCDLPQMWYYKRVQSNCKKIDREFNLTFEEFQNSYTGKCCLTGRDIKCVSKYCYSPGNQTASLDRINSSIGYNINNIQWLDWEVNHIKSNIPQDKFISLCNEISSHLNN